jgi:hypothetical protein
MFEKEKIGRIGIELIPRVEASVRRIIGFIHTG